MEYIENKYLSLCDKPSDINEHLPTLFEYASKCESIIECGVKNCVSSWALVYGLLNNNKQDKIIILNDIVYCDVTELLNITKNIDIDIKFIQCSNIDLELNNNIDLTFIDTYHVYGQLKRELTKYGKITNKYIIMHDTTIDEIYSESIRNKHDISLKMNETGYSYDEITIGLWKAIEEFLNDNLNWKIKERYINNNGLTILERI